MSLVLYTTYIYTYLHLIKYYTTRCCYLYLSDKTFVLSIPGDNKLFSFLFSCMCVHFLMSVFKFFITSKMMEVYITFPMLFGPYFINIVISVSNNLY